MDLIKYLRSDFATYVVPLMKKDKCEICDSEKGLELHHTYQMALMIDDTLKELKLKYKDSDEYTDTELLNIREKMLGKHLRYKHQTLCKECHKKETGKQLKDDKFGVRCHQLFGFNKDGEVDKDLIPIVKELYNIYNQHGTKKCIEFMGQYSEYYKSRASILNYMSNEKMINIVGKEMYDNFIQTKKSRNSTENKDVLTNRSNLKYESLLYHHCGAKMYISYSAKNISVRCRECTGRKDVRKSYSISKLENNLDCEIIKNMDDSLSEIYKNSTQEEQKAILRQIINKIIIYNYDSFEIIYK